MVPGLRQRSGALALDLPTDSASSRGLRLDIGHLHCGDDAVEHVADPATLRDLSDFFGAALSRYVHPRTPDDVGGGATTFRTPDDVLCRVHVERLAGRGVGVELAALRRCRYIGVHEQPLGVETRMCDLCTGSGGYAQSPVRGIPRRRGPHFVDNSGASASEADQPADSGARCRYPTTGPHHGLTRNLWNRTHRATSGSRVRPSAWMMWMAGWGVEVVLPLAGRRAARGGR